jgi:SAM-dependent methyltransferase
MNHSVIKSYGDLALHRTIGELIKRHSENGEDIREVAKRLVDWHDVRKIADLGCGYGWFEEALGNEFSLILGIDCLEANERGFLAVAQKAAEAVRFMNLQLPSHIDVESDYFDLVVAAYSLYFFPDVLPEVYRILRPGGTFLIITHSAAMLEEGEEFFDFSNLRQVINNFSAENGATLLRALFADITSVDYVNSLAFDKEQSDDLAKYIDFKREFISKDVSPVVVRAKMLDELETRGTMRFNKNDRIFVVKK